MVSRIDELLQDQLVGKGILTKDEIDKIWDGREPGQSFVQVLIASGAVDRKTVNALLAQKGYIYVDLANYQINSAAVSIVPEQIARKFMVIPIDFEGEKLVVAMANPSNVVTADDLHIMTGYAIKPVMSEESEIVEAINHYYKMSESVQQEVDEILGDDVDTASLSKLREVTEEAPTVKLVNHIIMRAVNERASDIHIEPQERDLRVRYRIDGVLHDILHSPKAIQAGVISRFKIMSSLDISEARKPQDGHCDLSVAGRMVDFRVATLPTVFGERITLRVLEKESIMLRLDDLGFLPESLERFRSAFTKPYGAILVTGPTGSGKSTTLYATLNVLNQESKNIVTIEDPVEYRLPGINQIQIEARSGLSFARCLRSVLRTSPDIIMVGEIRDRETSQIAIEAALTGHLVLSTLHTNDAPSAISRLTEMGIPPFLISSAISCVQAQRLARRLCKECKEPYQPSTAALERVGFPVGDGVPTLYKAKGCPSCNGTGYKGRVGVYEVMVVSEEIKNLCIKHATSEAIKKIAVEQGMLTLRQDGFEKVRLGTTSVEEVLRVIV
ncbi:MAG: Flp pilus assembly complex ATPase component TadA [Actinobacteria bacterium]|nr:Flp pilus assembly complex ATPase component TadA [Actinomycetota bacterium]